MNEVTIEAVSPFGIKYGGNEKWTNVDKKTDLGDLKTKYHAGDVVNVTLNQGGFITGMELVTSAPPKPAWKGGSGKPFTPRDPMEGIKKGRGAAIKAVLEAPFFNEQMKNKSTEQALVQIAFPAADMIANYIEKGA